MADNRNFNLIVNTYSCNRYELHSGNYTTKVVFPPSYKIQIGTTRMIAHKSQQKLGLVPNLELGSLFSKSGCGRIWEMGSEIKCFLSR